MARFRVEWESDLMNPGERGATCLVDWPEDRAEFWRRVSQFVGAWHDSPLDQADGAPESELREAEQRLDIRLPAALREWHLLASRRRELWDPPDPDGFPYLEPDIWAPSTFCRLGEESRPTMGLSARRAIIDRHHPLVFSVIHGGMATYSYWIARDRLNRNAEDPPVNEPWDWEGKPWHRRNEFDSITRMAASILMVRANEARPIRLSILREYGDGQPDLSGLIAAANARGFFRRCDWFRPFFDVITDSRVAEIHEGPNCLALRLGDRPVSPDRPARDVVSIAFRDAETARDAAKDLDLLGKLPDSWRDDPTNDPLAWI